MSKLDNFMLSSEQRHNFLVSEIQKSEQRVVDEISDKYEKRILSLENWRIWINGVCATVSGFFVLLKMEIIKLGK